MATVYLLLGTNIGCRSEYLKKAASFIEETVGIIERSSAVYETAAWGQVKQDDYLNQVLQIKTGLTPESLLEKTANIEKRLGRKRKTIWGPRTIDIDILFYDKFICFNKVLTLPHPYIPKRRFVLIPLAEIAPSLIHPVLQKTITQLLSECADTLRVEKYETADIS